MLKFKTLELGDITRLSGYFHCEMPRRGVICDCTPIGTFMWRDFFHTEYAITVDSCLFKVVYFGGETAFTMPLSIHNTQRCLAQIAEYAVQSGIPLAFCAVVEEDFDELRKVFGGVETVTDRKWSDYVYNAEDLVTLSGRRYSGQRNHINKFNKLYPGAVFEDITTENFREAAEFIRRAGTRGSDMSPMAREEAVKSAELAENFEVYRPLGGMIRVDGAVAAVAYGEIIGQTLFVHVEKADLSYEGVYPVIVREFAARYKGEGIRYINRGEDDGVEGLRTVKLSYHPSALIDKYIVRIKIS